VSSDPTRTLAARVREIRPNPAGAVGRSVVPFGLGIAAAFILQIVVAPMIGDFYAKLMLDIGIAIILAASLNVVNGFAGQFSIGHAGFMMVGGYAAALVTYYGSVKLFMPPELCAGPDGRIPDGAWLDVQVQGGFMGMGDLLFLVSCVIGGLVAALAGLVVGLPSLRLRGDYLAIVTLGFGEIVRVLVQQTKGVVEPAAACDIGGDAVTHLGGALGFTGAPTYVSPTPWKVDAGGNPTGHAGIFFTFAIVGILLVLAYRLKSSSTGRALLAVRENEIAAEAMGVDTARTKVTAFIFSAFFGGVGGGLFAHELGVTLNPKELGFQKSIDLVIMVVLGGMGSISGVVVAATILTILPELFRDFEQYRMPAYALALIIVMIVRPQGLFGIQEVWELKPRIRYVKGTLVAAGIGLVVWQVLGLFTLDIDSINSLRKAFSSIGALTLFGGLAGAAAFGLLIGVDKVAGKLRAGRGIAKAQALPAKDKDSAP
jgi:branched-chain amino acid transport system permease protein